MSGKILAAPLAQPFAGDGGAIAEFGGQRLYEARSTQIIVEKLINDSGNIVEEAASVDEELIVSCAAGNVEVIATAAVKLRIHPVQGKRDNGVDVGPQGCFVPSGVDLAGSDILEVIRKAEDQNTRCSRIPSRNSKEEY